MNDAGGSRIPGFHNLPVDERQTLITKLARLDYEEHSLLLSETPLTLEAAARLTENTVGVYAFPMGLALNFVVNGEDVLVPMVTEEPSVIAAASNAARLARSGGGFVAEADPPCMIAQVQLIDVPAPEEARARLEAEAPRICARVDELAPGMARRGGGARGVEARVLDAPDGQKFVVVHLLVDVGDAMGANAINTIAEQAAPLLEEISGGTAHLRILSNLTDRRCGRASVRYRLEDLAMKGRTGEEVGRGVELASLFAEADPYRATTHNKGIMNGVDAVALATGNDWRALEAGAHAFAARNGQYGALSTWRVDGSELVGRIELPLAVGTVGATVEGNPRARLALKLMGVTNGQKLIEIIAAVGLAQNFGAVRALATEGIQKGHMARHARAVAAAAGALPDQVEQIATTLIAEGEIKVERARRLLSGTSGDDPE
ncbi:MAG: hydroxymethylglutaryl-CoA reductase, degradative [Candidatus Binatia bacterium]|nr:hydroxymethylglutaryl-CoA reductase, degradative [Candidatus Binatia bacterium]